MKTKKNEILQCRSCDNLLLVLGHSQKSCQSRALKPPPINMNQIMEKEHEPTVSNINHQLMITIGLPIHPMTERHHIEWILIMTEDGFQCEYLNLQTQPSAIFYQIPSKVQAVYCYCNLHGLWKSNQESYFFSELVCSAEFPQECI